ncbi:NAD-dependent succinate-semialdehyde dehydrogenase [Candidatus Paracaedibacter symbiosus]|uniref:NAD-dependent succinate-semialdehyde dehydrogenase n=1 Tax=Candidatus Paracaedibacter symbiosus TaxID=244582 RepID=UPI000509DF0A|nr:NAD-dependent succinate-semialdehyde dehydrogenase [Candidatus Paracaedibacter symbiosus]
MILTSINPYSGDVIATYPEQTFDDAKIAVTQIAAAQKEWAEVPVAERAALFVKVAAILRAKKNDFATLMTLEMGKPILQAKTEVEKCAAACDYFAQHGPLFLTPEKVNSEAHKSFVSFEPLGVILAIMPWNFPFWQAFRAAIPALIAGNGMLLKHAANVSGCALAIAHVFNDAGFPRHLFQSLLIKAETADQLIAHPLVAAVTLTGSTRAGRQVAAKAGQFIKRCVLELGGSDPYIILEDADLPEAAAICAASRLQNNGQSCIAAKRFIVVEKHVREFEQFLFQEFNKAVMGDPLNPETTIGPMARADLRETLHHQVMRSIAKGAEFLAGGTIPESKGFFYPPTILTSVKKGMPAFDEELFGPVAPIISATDEEHAIELANDTVYGLGAAVFTQDIEKGEKIAKNRLKAGNCFVNAMVKSDWRFPFGGIKESGFGRELSSIGIKEFVNIKTVVIHN